MNKFLIKFDVSTGKLYKWMWFFYFFLPQRLHIVTSPRIEPAKPEKLEDESTISVEGKGSVIGSDELNDNSLPPPVYNELVVEDEKKNGVTTKNGGVENKAFSVDEE